MTPPDSNWIKERLTLPGSGLAELKMMHLHSGERPQPFLYKAKRIVEPAQ